MSHLDLNKKRNLIDFKALDKRGNSKSIQEKIRYLKNVVRKII